MFKSGDRVICIDSKNTKHLIRSRVYRVLDVFEMDEKISLVGLDSSYKYDEYRFINDTENKFKNGEKIVLIDDSGNIKLKKGDIYTISRYYKFIDGYDELNINVFLYEKNEHFEEDRFISLKEYRKQKMQKIYSSQVIK